MQAFKAYRLKLGLEVHAQLLAKQKLFSRAPTSFQAEANSQVAYFDAAIPGTQPKISWACVNLALRAGIALNTFIHPFFSFDRKHYMYPDQPLGYQITQRREPIATNGYLDLYARDFTSQSQYSNNFAKRIRISQIQMEQDTGKTSYVDNMSLVDLNRANTGLIELVTCPDFESEDEAVAFIRKLQLLLKRLRVCSGEMESGAMRVDVNVSVADENGADLGERCEIKNLFSTSAVRSAVKAEFARQCNELARGNSIERETRGWDGKNTWRLRSKESVKDYRYMPDPDLPRFLLSEEVVDKVRSSLPEAPDLIWDKLVGDPYNLAETDARTIIETEGASEFCFVATKLFLSGGGKPQSAKLVGTWLVHRWLGESDFLPSNTQQFVDVLIAADNKRISTTSARLLLRHIAQGFSGSIDDIIAEFGLESEPASETSELVNTCKRVVASHPEVVERIKRGKKSSLGFLLGQVMKETQGTLDPKNIKAELKVAIESSSPSDVNS